ncbi:hypothetical protein D0T57_12685 [Dysgonomonas sp. 511]|nr:hypothetical protein [Dysgonomonas sp. 511]
MLLFATSLPALSNGRESRKATAREKKITMENDKKGVTCVTFCHLTPRSLQWEREPQSHDKREESNNEKR